MASKIKKAKVQVACGNDGLDGKCVELIRNIKSAFLIDLVIYYATSEDIKKLKEAGLNGISRKQRKSPQNGLQLLT